MNESLLFLAALSTVASGLCAVVAMVWLRHFRRAVARELATLIAQQNDLALRTNKAMEQAQKRLETDEDHLQKIAEAHLLLHQDLTALTTRVETSERALFGTPETRVLN